MKRKQSEESLRTMMASYGWKANKGRDRGYVSCPSCRQLVQQCPHCNGDMLLPKAKTRLDFMVMFTWTEIECKQGHDSWPLNDFTDAQEKLLPKKLNNGLPRWIFLEIGRGRAPSGRDAFLIPADIFLEKRLSLGVQGMKSVRFRGTDRSTVPEARTVFEEYQLDWKANTGWQLPEKHEFWATFPEIRAQFDDEPITESDIVGKEHNGDKTVRIAPTPPRPNLLGEG